MPRTNKKTAVIDANSVSIADFCQSQGINEQIFRLELMQHQEDADSSKFVEFEVARSVASVLLSQTKTLPSAETVTTPELQPATDITGDSTSQDTGKLAQTQSPQGMEVNHKNPSTKGTVPSALTEAINKAQEDIELFDLVSVYRNETILNNSETRDKELVLRLREQRLENRNQVFSELRELNSRQPTAPELPELPQSLADEIDALSRELGKQINLR